MQKCCHYTEVVTRQQAQLGIGLVKNVRNRQDTMVCCVLPDKQEDVVKAGPLAGANQCWPRGNAGQCPAIDEMVVAGQTGIVKLSRVGRRVEIPAEDHHRLG